MYWEDEVAELDGAVTTTVATIVVCANEKRGRKSNSKSEDCIMGDNSSMRPFLRGSYVSKSCVLGNCKHNTKNVANILDEKRRGSMVQKLTRNSGIRQRRPLRKDSIMRFEHVQSFVVLLVEIRGNLETGACCDVVRAWYPCMAP